MSADSVEVATLRVVPMAVRKHELSTYFSYILSFVVIFALLYEPVLVVTGSGVMSLVLVGTLVWSLVLGKGLYRSAEFLSMGFVLIAGLALALGTAQLLALSKGGDIYFLQLLVAALISYIPISYFAARILGHRSNASTMACRMLALVCLFQSFFIFLDWFVPVAHNLLAAIVKQPELVDRSYRVAGLSSSTGDGLSFKQAIGAMAAMHLSATSNSRKVRFLWVMTTGLCLLSMIFVGRTGVVMFVVFIIAYWIGSPSRGSVVRSCLTLLVTYGAIGGLAALLMPAPQRDLLFNTVLPVAFEAAFSLVRGDGLNVDSLQELTGRMIFLPESAFTLLLGDGYWRNPIGFGNYVPSDIGYIRSIYYVGVFGSLIIYLWYALLWYVLRRMAVNGSMRPFVDGFFAALFLAHAKFPFLYSGTTLICCFLLFFVMYADHQSGVLFIRRIRSLYENSLKILPASTSP